MAYGICVLRKDEFVKFLNKLDNDSRARLVRDIDFLEEVVHWFIKKTKKIPIRELKTAIKRLTEI
jgi:phage-related protein